MTDTSTGTSTVSLLERAMLLPVLRLLYVGAALAVPLGPDATRRQLLLVAATYLVVTMGASVAWYAREHRSLVLFSVPLLADAAALAYLVHATGWMASPLRFALFLHVVAVVLVVSYRTGVKVGLGTALALVVVDNAREVGALTATTPTETSEFVALLVAVAVLTLATGTFSAINERELRRRRQDLAALARLAGDVDAADDLVTAGRRAVAHLADIADAERVLLFTADASGLALQAQQGVGATAEVAPPPATSPLTVAMRDQVTLRLAALPADTAPVLHALLPAANGVVVVPLVAGDDAVGVVVIELGGRSVPGRLLELLERCAELVAQVVRSRGLLEEVRLLAATDPLTRIANRGTFQSALGRELAQARRNGSSVSLVLLDIDHFKRLNDDHGHLTGDAVLKSVANLLDVTSRDGDLAARYGGEEFVVLMPDTDVEVAFAAAERVRSALSRADRDLQVTASAGVATFPDHADDGEDLIAVADAALYRSKAGGRDRLTQGERRDAAATA